MKPNSACFSGFKRGPSRAGSLSLGRYTQSLPNAVSRWRVNPRQLGPCRLIANVGDLRRPDSLSITASCVHEPSPSVTLTALADCQVLPGPQRQQCSARASLTLHPSRQPLSTQFLKIRVRGRSHPNTPPTPLLAPSTPQGAALRVISQRDFTFQSGH